MLAIALLGNEDCDPGSICWVSCSLQRPRFSAEPKDRVAAAEPGKSNDRSPESARAWHARHSLLSIGSALLIMSTCANSVHAQSRLELKYTTSVAGLSLAELTVNGTLGRSEYTISSDGTILSRMPGQSGKNPFYRGSHIVNGTVSEESRLSPTKFSTTDSFFGQREERSVTFEDGNVKEITASKSSQTEASLADQYGRGVVDPLTAMLVPGALTDAACKGTVRVFDGRQRFDVALTFRRMGQAKAKDGYAGPALVCSGKYKPIAGKGESAFMPSFISDYLAGQEPEVILAPLSGTRLLALFRVSLNTVVGSIVVQATQFKALAR
jgi:hypothetical protein